MAIDFNHRFNKIDTDASADLSIVPKVVLTDTISIGNGAYTLPIADGTGGYILKTDGFGVVTWQSEASGDQHFVAEGTPSVIPTATGTDSIAIGDSADSSANYSIAIGQNSTSSHINSIAIGQNSTSTAANQLIIGGTSGAVSDVYIGNGVTNASASAFVLNSTGASGTDIAAANITIAGGRGTGTGVGGTIYFKVATPGTTGSSLNPLVEALRIEDDTNAFFAGSLSVGDSATTRTNLGLAIGTDVQAYDATLLSIATLGTAADKMLYTTGVDTWVEATLTSVGRALIDDATVAAQRTTLGLGTSAVEDVGVTDGDVVQVTTGNKLPVIDGSNLTNVASQAEDSTRRQTALSGLSDANGIAAYIIAGTGLNADIDTTTGTDDLILSFADGFDVTYGKTDYVESITSDQTSYFGTLTANAENYLYVDRNTGTGALTGGHIVNLPPIYGDNYISAEGAGKSYCNFDGTDAATSFTDANGEAWTFSDNAQLDTADKKFGSASVLFDGTSDYISSTKPLYAGEFRGGFQVSVWINLDVTGTERNFWGSKTGQHALLATNTSEKLLLKLGDGSTWTITTGTAGTTTLSTSTWYRVRLVWDTLTYKVYLSNNGAAESEEISVTSSVAFAPDNQGYQLGSYADTTTAWDGHIDEFSYIVGPQTLGTETPITSALGGLAVDTEHWFNTITMKMQYWDQGTTAWIEKQRIFIGEAATNGSSVTDVVSYAFRGLQTIDWFAWTTSTYTEKAHTLGMVPGRIIPKYKFLTGTNNLEPDDVFKYTSISSGDGLSRVTTFKGLRNLVSFYMNDMVIHHGNNIGVSGNTELGIELDRGW